MQSELSWHVLGVITRKDSAGACFFQRFGRYGAFHGRSIAACGHMKQGWLSKGELDEFRSVLTARTAEVKVVHHCTCAAPSATLMLSTHSYSLLTAPVFAQHADNASTPQLAAGCAAKATPLDKTLDTGHTYRLAAESIGKRLETINNAVLHSIPIPPAGTPLCASAARRARPQPED